jgi:hypothetical protein
MGDLDCIEDMRICDGASRVCGLGLFEPADHMLPSRPALVTLCLVLSQIYRIDDPVPQTDIIGFIVAE